MAIAQLFDTAIMGAKYLFTQKIYLYHRDSRWLNAMLHLPTGSLAKSDLDQLAAECDRYRKIRFSMGYYLHNPLGN
ncbi:hypothetical protein [Coleofasciculus sp. FACHB-129]|uniref:hypothetical protein n=1 Tax=Cyanophyceae TaxID=3028117 RepID=UPI0016890E99|nr:hypothetical protein [Coleofasciculus sp. FACHB-129]MBD1895833.1 hypothetical protein [Coleofasciculus sp. FACHB-129]